MEVAQRAQQTLGHAVFDDHNAFCACFDAVCKAQDARLSAPEKKVIYKAVSWRDDAALPVIAKRSKLKAGDYFEPGFDGAYLETVGKDRFMVEYEPDSALRDTEQVPLKEPGGIDAFFPAKCCRTRRTPGSLRTRLRLATRFLSLAISTSPCRCGRWPKSVPISSCWSSRRKGCCIRLWGA